jgi:hypothetical protein
MAREFDTLGELLKARGVNLTNFGKSMGWTQPTTSMKLNRNRAWSIDEYELALERLQRRGIRISRKDMLRMISRRPDDGDA